MGATLQCESHLQLIPTMRIALAQTCPISAPKGTWASQNRGASDLFRDLVKNLELAELHIARAAKEKADVVCFPEYFLEGILNEGRQVSG